MPVQRYKNLKRKSLKENAILAQKFRKYKTNNSEILSAREYFSALPGEARIPRPKACKCHNPGGGKITPLKIGTRAPPQWAMLAEVPWLAENHVHRDESSACVRVNRPAYPGIRPPGSKS